MKIAFEDARREHEAAELAYSAACATIGGRNETASEAEMIAAYGRMMRAPVRSNGDAVAALRFLADNDSEVGGPAVLRRVARFLARPAA